MAKIKLTKDVVDGLNYTGKQDFFWDTSMEGFGVCVGAKYKTAYAQTRAGQSDQASRRVSIGRISESFTFDQAKRQAKIVLGSMTAGSNPIAARRANKAAKVIAQTECITFDKAFQAFLEERNHKPKTAKDYKNVYNDVLADWHSKPVVSFTEDDVSKIYSGLVKQNKVGYANLWVGCVRSMINFANTRYKLQIKNPFKVLGENQTRKKNKTRKGYIHEVYLNAVFSALDNLENKDAADAFRMLLLTGCRLNEVLSLKWSNVNLVSRKFTVRDPKNNFDVDLPLSDYLLAIMIDRFQARTTKYVFPGDGKTGHLVETKRPMARLIEKTNQLLKIEHEELHQEIEFTAHDFRRTFSTMAHRAGIDPYTIKGLLNHLQKNDITGQYIQIPVEELSMPHARVNEFMLKNVKDKRMSTMR